MNRIYIFTFILAVALAVTACTGGPKPEVVAEETTVAIPVKVMPMAKTKISRTVDYTATIQAFEEVNMAPSQPGRVDEIYVEVGDRVQKGQKLFLMDRTSYHTLRISLATQEKDLARMDTLLKVGSLAQQVYDLQKSSCEVTRANVEFLEKNTLLEAPFSGIITGKYFENGELYTGAPSQTGKSAVVTLMQINPLKITVSISEQSYPLIKNGMQVRVTADVYPDKTFTGRIFRIHPTINPMSRTFQAEIELPNNGEQLRPGMFARVYIDMGEVETFVVPSNIVMAQEGTNDRFVFVVNNGVASRREVKLGKRFDDMVEIAEGNIREGDNLVIEGQARLVDGRKVELGK